MSWEIVVGIETHAQLLTRSKIFSGASTDFGAPPNTQASAVDLALPGTLPVLNRAAVELAIRFGVVVGGPEAINRRSIFARKNYFYPDLPKGYQISQYEQPIVKAGSIEIASATRGNIKVQLTRAHLEEDAGKSLHEDFHGMTGIDLNRAGTPLLEIVSEPELRSPQEAVAYAQALHRLVTEYEICDGNMEEGSFRCDANVSVRRPGQALGTRCEIKNLNSFQFLEQAITYEVERQIAVLEAGGKIEQETLLFDPGLGETRPMRSKEDAQDYRYFPDPDLLPVVITEDDIQRVRAEMPTSLDEKRARFERHGISTNASIAVTTALTPKTKLLDKVVDEMMRFQLDKNEQAEALTSAAHAIVSAPSSRIDDWASRESRGDLNEINLPLQLAVVALMEVYGEISGRQAKEVRERVLAGEGSAEDIIKKHGLKQIIDAGAIEKLVDEVLARNAKQVEDYRAGKDKAFNSLVGQVMKATQGKANPAQVNEILRKRLGR